MRTLLLILACHSVWAQSPSSGERHEFVIANFRTRAASTLPKARIVYGTYGQLNARKDNAVLLPSHYMANFHGYEWLIGPGKRARSRRAVSGRDRAVRQRQFVFAEQHAGAVSRAALSGNHHPRQRGSRPPAADRGARRSLIFAP